MSNSLQGTTSFRIPSAQHNVGRADHVEEDLRLRLVPRTSCGSSGNRGLEDKGSGKAIGGRGASPPGLQRLGDRICKICGAPGLASWGQSWPRALTTNPGARRASTWLHPLRSTHPPASYPRPRGASLCFTCCRYFPKEGKAVKPAAC